MLTRNQRRPISLPPQDSPQHSDPLPNMHRLHHPISPRTRLRAVAGRTHLTLHQKHLPLDRRPQIRKRNRPANPQTRPEIRRPRDRVQRPRRRALEESRRRAGV